MRNTKLKVISKEKTGQAMAEFAIICPVLIMLFLMIIQTALLMTAKIVVNYAAYCAARGAIVNGDKDVDGIPSSPEETLDEMTARAQRAAEIGCMSLVPELNDEIQKEFEAYIANLGTIPIGTVEVPASDMGIYIAGVLNERKDILGLYPGIELIDDIYGNPDSDLPFRLLTSKLLTEVEIKTDTIYIERTDGEDPVAVTNIQADVIHNYAMRVPLVNKAFFYMYLFGAEDGEKEYIESDTLNMYLLPIKASMTLTMENDLSGQKCCD